MTPHRGPPVYRRRRLCPGIGAMRLYTVRFLDFWNHLRLKFPNDTNKCDKIDIWLAPKITEEKRKRGDFEN